MATAAHEPWEQLAVGHALDALEPDDEAQFLAHLPTCATCRRVVDDTRAVMGELAVTAEPLEPPRSLWERIRAEVDTSARKPVPAPAPPPAARGGSVVALPPSTPQRWARVTTAVAVAAALLGAVVTGGVAFVVGNDRGTAARQLNQVLGCVESPQCRMVRLTGESEAAAVAMLRGESIRLVVDGLPRNNRAKEIYVLWQATPSGTMKAVATFDVTSGRRHLLDAEPVAPLGSAAVFAVSRERGRSAPATPSRPLMKGSAV